ncbi:MAG: Lrp/AsnC family transcriptional regulator [bacterium]|nr:Lrp/AsnC family transcriptional regulator [bacterium]
MIDELDRKILEILQSDARIPNSEIAKQIGIVPSATAERIKKLVQRGIIAGYDLRLNAKSVELGLVAFIFVKADEPVNDCSTALELAKIPEVLEIHNIAGEDCYLLKARVRDAESLGRFLREKVGTIPTVKNTRTVIALETFKENGPLPLDEAMKGKLYD